MKVAMIDPSLFTGRYDDGLCDGLTQAGLDVTLFARPMRHTDAIVPNAYAYVPRFFRWSERLRNALGEGRAFRVAKAVEYGASCLTGSVRGIADADVVHVQWLPLAAADAMLLRRLAGRMPLVHTVHNAKPYHADAGMQAAGYRALLDRFDALVVHGETTRAALETQGVDRARIHILPHPPMRLADATASDLTAVPDPKCPRILFFGTIRPYKGVDLLVEACLSLWNEGRQFELAIAGKDFMDIVPLIDRVRRAGFGDRLIVELGFLREQRLDAHLRKADILAFPYRHIDSSGAFLSALHYGKAMLVSDAGMFAALPDGVAARVPVGNVAALAQALLPLIESAAIRQTAGTQAIAYGQTIGDWKDMALHTAAIYRTVMERRSA